MGNQLSPEEFEKELQSLKNYLDFPTLHYL
jgi:hypothetical protein